MTKIRVNPQAVIDNYMNYFNDIVKKYEKQLEKTEVRQLIKSNAEQALEILYYLQENYTKSEDDKDLMYQVMKYGRGHYNPDFIKTLISEWKDSLMNNEIRETLK